jgi:hypothetical protein
MSDEPVKSDAAVEQALRKLPRAVEPSRDLWSGIAAAIEADRATHAAPSSDTPSIQKRWPGSWNGGWALAAGVACVGIIGLLVHTHLQRTQIAPTVAQQITPTPATTVSPAEILSTPDPHLVPAAFGPDYVKTRDAALQRLTEQLQSLSPADQQKVRAALQEINKGLRALNDALAKSPDSILLQQLVLSAYQQQLQTLQTMTETTAMPNIQTNDQPKSQDSHI